MADPMWIVRECDGWRERVVGSHPFGKKRRMDGALDSCGVRKGNYRFLDSSSRRLTRNDSGTAVFRSYDDMITLGTRASGGGSGGNSAWGSVWYQ